MAGMNYNTASTSGRSSSAYSNYRSSWRDDNDRSANSYNHAPRARSPFLETPWRAPLLEPHFHIGNHNTAGMNYNTASTSGRSSSAYSNYRSSWRDDNDRSPNSYNHTPRARTPQREPHFHIDNHSTTPARNYRTRSSRRPNFTPSAFVPYKTPARNYRTRSSRRANLTPSAFAPSQPVFHHYNGVRSELRNAFQCSSDEVVNYNCSGSPMGDRRAQMAAVMEEATEAAERLIREEEERNARDSRGRLSSRKRHRKILREEGVDERCERMERKVKIMKREEEKQTGGEPASRKKARQPHMNPPMGDRRAQMAAVMEEATEAAERLIREERKRERSARDRREERQTGGERPSRKKARQHDVKYARSRSGPVPASASFIAQSTRSHDRQPAAPEMPQRVHEERQKTPEPRQRTSLHETRQKTPEAHQQQPRSQPSEKRVNTGQYVRAPASHQRPWRRQGVRYRSPRQFHPPGLPHDLFSTEGRSFPSKKAVHEAAAEKKRLSYAPGRSRFNIGDTSSEDELTFTEEEQKRYGFYRTPSCSPERRPARATIKAAPPLVPLFSTKSAVSAYVPPTVPPETTTVSPLFGPSTTISSTVPPNKKSTMPRPLARRNVPPKDSTVHQSATQTTGLTQESTVPPTASTVSLAKQPPTVLSSNRTATGKEPDLIVISDDDEEISPLELQRMYDRRSAARAAALQSAASRPATPQSAAPQPFVESVLYSTRPNPLPDPSTIPERVAIAMQSRVRAARPLPNIPLSLLFPEEGREDNHRALRAGERCQRR